MEADGCLAKGLHFLEPLRIGGPAGRQLQEVAPSLVRRVLQNQADEFVGDGEVELARIREISALQDGFAAGLERMRLEQISRGIAVAAQHLGAQQLVVGHRLEEGLPRRRQLELLQRRQGQAKVLRNLPQVLAVSDQGGAQLQELVGQEAVRRNGQKERLRGGDQTKRALGVVVLQELAGDAHEQARRIEALVCHRQHAGQRLVEVIARGLEVEDEPRSPGGEKLQLGEERRDCSPR